jgi:Mg2+ and Co2+ transporter CorA
MTEELSGATINAAGFNPRQPLSGTTIEQVAIAGAAAIQRIIAERDELRNHAIQQQVEISELRESLGELRRHMHLIRDQYLRLATEFLSQLKQVDRTIQEGLQRSTGEVADDDSSLISLAQRLSPVGQGGNGGLGKR